MDTTYIFIGVAVVIVAIVVIYSILSNKKLTITASMRTR